MPAVVEKFSSFVQGGIFWSIDDIPFFDCAQVAGSCCGLEWRSSAVNFPLDIVIRLLVLQLPQIACQGCFCSAIRFCYVLLMPSVSFFKCVGSQTHLLLHIIVGGHRGPVHKVICCTFVGERTFCWVHAVAFGLGVSFFQFRSSKLCLATVVLKFGKHLQDNFTFFQFNRG